MNVSTPRHLSGADAQAGPQSGMQECRDLNRRLRMTEGVQRLLLGALPHPDDTILFRMLLADDGGSDASMATDRREAHAGQESIASIPDRRDDIARVTSRHAGVDRRQNDASDVIPVGALDLAALSGVVSKVYLDSLRDQRRAIGMALNEDLLPATRLSILEREGRLAVDFVSMSSLTRERLRRGAASLADRIAGDLSRDVSVKVASHDDDRLALEVHADASAVTQRQAAA
jgi:hypothetical protein